MKEILAAGGWSAGVIIPMADAQVVEVCGMIGFTHVMIDGEHGHISVRDCEDLVRAAHVVDITPIVRVPTNAPHEILRFLDTGAQGVVIPQVTTRDDAERAVAAARYHPRGHRGLAGTRAASYGLGGPLGPYAQEANEKVLVTALIEDVRAIDHLPDILAVEGLDTIAIGPSDLSQSMGHPGNPKAPPVARAIKGALARIRAAGRTPGMPATADTLGEVVGNGCRYVYTHLPRLLSSGAAAFFLARP